MVPAARHILYGFNLPGREFHKLQDYKDDDEHGGGRIILGMLQNAEVVNRVIYVARIYDGTHIGQERFEAIKEAARSVVTQNSYNCVTKTHQRLLTQEQEIPWEKPKRTVRQTHITTAVQQWSEEREGSDSGSEDQ